MYNRYTYTQITATIKTFFLFFCYIIMEHPTSNKNINAIKEIRRLFNELRSNQKNDKPKITKKIDKKM